MIRFMNHRFRRMVCLTASVMGFALLISVTLNPSRFLLTNWRSQYSADDRVRQFGPSVLERLQPLCAATGLHYPPDQIAIVAFKDTKLIELYGFDDQDNSWRLITTYPILGSSGVLGPKIREGDRQVPEGIYRAQSLNPNSRFHLAIRVNYPNVFDQQMAVADGRTRPGGDIMIHGGSSSIGCLAVGDQAAEDLFILAALAGIDHVQIIISPTDFRDSSTLDDLPNSPQWAPQLYDQLRSALEQFPKGKL